MLKQLHVFTSVLVKVVDIYLHFVNNCSQELSESLLSPGVIVHELNAFLSLFFQ